MERQQKNRLQMVIALVVIGGWVVGGLIATFDGTTLLAITTPLLTTLLGWLFASRATGTA